jgi:hypothetical protein
MPYHTAGGWIQAFSQAVNDLLVGRSGPLHHTFHAQPCPDHVDCVLVEYGGIRRHIPWREHDPTATAASITQLQ